jgi:hypothetical protein
MSSNDYCFYYDENEFIIDDSNSSSSSLLLIFPIMFYIMLGYGCCKIASLHYKNLETLELLEECNNNDDNVDNDDDNNKIEYTYSHYTGEVLKSSMQNHDDTYKNNLFRNLLSLHSLDRSYILYFIFKKKGNFLSSIISGEKKKYNSYDLFNKIREHYNLEHSEFTLDDTQIPNIIITIGDEEHYLTKYQLLFIQWLYYTGLYDYLTTTMNLKYKILNEMNEEGVFISNVFLRYHIFLCDYEDMNEKNKNNNKNEKTNDDNESNDYEDIYSLSDIENIYSLSDIEDLDFSNYVYETTSTTDETTSTTTDELTNETTDEIEKVSSDENYDFENDIELKKCKGINNINEIDIMTEIKNEISDELIQ